MTNNQKNQFCSDSDLGKGLIGVKPLQQSIYWTRKYVYFILNHGIYLFSFASVQEGTKFFEKATAGEFFLWLQSFVVNLTLTELLLAK